MEERLSNLICGALLHDIGKILYRAGEGRGNHAERGADFLRALNFPDGIVNLCRFHHDSELRGSRSADHLILCESDWLSSAERPEKEEAEERGRWEPYVPLLNPFSKLSLNHSEEPSYTGAWSFFPVRPLEGEDLPFPSADPKLSGEEEYRKLVESLKGRLESLPPNPELLLPVLEGSLSFVPSETRLAPAEGGMEVSVRGFKADPARMPDISLFDHLKTTAAIASAMFLYLLERGDEGFEEGLSSWDVIRRRDEARYLLVGGDISGVQRFIYTISSKGALKGLRARSFWLEMLTQHVAAQIIERLHLSSANIIFCGGGRFLLLLPNTEGAREALRQIKTLVNRWLYDRHGLRLYLALGFVPLCGMAFLSSWWKWRGRRDGIPRPLRAEVERAFYQCDSCEFARGESCSLLGELKPRPLTIPDALEALNRRLGEEKGKKFADMLDFRPREQERGRCEQGCEDVPFECQICHVENVKIFRHANPPDADPIHACPFCFQLWKLGRLLPRVRFLARFPEGVEVSASSDKAALFELPGAVYLAAADLKDIEEAARAKPEALFVLNSFEPGFRPLLIANYIVDPEESPDFKELARRAVGADRLAVLRADVDNLGRLISRGIHRGEYTFSRMASVSRLLNLFFKLGVNGLCRGRIEGGEPVGVVKRGGERNLAVVYSGGDDLFIAGAYDEVLELAFDISRAFRRFVGGNPDVTLSGGIVIFPEGYPIHLIAESAREAEEEAKGYRGGRKNAISLLYNAIREPSSRVFGWDEAEKLLHMVELFAREFGSVKGNRLHLHERIPRGLLFRILEIARFWEEEGKLYLPRAAWLIARARPPEGKEEAWEEFRRWLLDPENARHFRAFATWLILLTRGGERR